MKEMKSGGTEVAEDTKCKRYLGIGAGDRFSAAVSK